MDKSHRSSLFLWLFFFGLLSFTTVFGNKIQDIPNNAQDRTRRDTEDFRIRRNVGAYIEVSGRISFTGKAPEIIPSNSQLHVQLIDIKLADAAHIELESILVDLSNYNNNIPLFYNITSKKPTDLHDMHSIAAVLNMGWIPKGGEDDEWLRHGDYHTTHSFMVNVTSGTDKFVRDIEMEIFRSHTSAAALGGPTSAAVLGGKYATSVAVLLLLLALFLPR